MQAAASQQQDNAPTDDQPADATQAPLSLADVSNLTVSQLWVRVFANLSLSEVVRGRGICKDLRRELPRLVTYLSLRQMASAAARRSQVLAFGTFSQLSFLRLNAPLSISPEQDSECIWDDPPFTLPQLQTLLVQVVEDSFAVNLQPHHFPKLRKFEFEHVQTDGPAGGTALQFGMLLPTLQELKINCVTFSPNGDQVGEGGAVSQFCEALRAAPLLHSVSMRRCCLSASPHGAHGAEGGRGVLGGDLPSLEGMELLDCQLWLRVLLDAPRLKHFMLAEDFTWESYNWPAGETYHPRELRVRVSPEGAGPRAGTRAVVVVNQAHADLRPQDIARLCAQADLGVQYTTPTFDLQ